MKRKSLRQARCPIARGLDHVGEWWSILIIRDAFRGKARFDEFQSSLGIAPNMLTRRLNALVDGGLLERRLYCERPPRYEYALTPRGRAFRPVLRALFAWGEAEYPLPPHLAANAAGNGAAAKSPRPRRTEKPH